MIKNRLTKIVLMYILNKYMIRSEVYQFEWDEGNLEHIKKHNVFWFECEEVFFDNDKKILKDVIHSKNEERYIILGKTKKKRLLFVVFTIRNKKIRVITSRDLNRKEVKLYEEKTKNSKI